MKLINNLITFAKSVWLWFLKASIIKKLIVVAVVLLLGWFIFSRISAANKKPQYQTAQVTRGSIISTVTESGNVSGNQVSVGSPSTGVIEELYVKNGDQVSEGDQLFKVKATATPQEQAAAYASYENALNAEQSAEEGKLSSQATLEKDRQAVINAQINVNTMQGNVGASQPNPTTKQSYTQNDIDAINSALTSAKETFTADEKKYNDANTAIAAAQAQLNSASLAYQATQDSIVTAPIGGTVANLAVSMGSDVSASGGSSSSGSNAGGSTGGTGTSATTTSAGSAGSSTSAGSTVLVIGDFSSNLQIKVQASEVDVPSIHAGQKATITLDAFPGKTFVGTVTGVDTIGTTTSGVVTYNVYVTFAYAPDGVQPGMTASVAIETNRKDDVLTVPSTAVQTINGSSFVRVLQNGKITEVPVETGLTSDTDTEITSGLSEGDTVITSFTTTTTGQTTSPFSGFGGRGFGGGGSRGGGAVIRTGGGG